MAVPEEMFAPTEKVVVASSVVLTRGVVGAGIGVGVGAVVASPSSHTQPLQSHPSCASASEQLIAISSHECLCTHVVEHVDDTRAIEDSAASQDAAAHKPMLPELVARMTWTWPDLLACLPFSLNALLQ